MTNWAELTHAYGSAEDIPAMLDALTPAPFTEEWHDLWSAVCHQGSVYSASAAVLPHLLAKALEWAPRDRLAPLVLAGAIVASRDPSADFDIAPWRTDVEGLEKLAVETLTTVDLEHDDYIALLQATVALQGHSLWGRQFDRLAEGNLFGTCPACGAELDIEIDAHGAELQTTSGGPGSRIDPAGDTTPLEGIGRSMHQLAVEAEQPRVAQALRHIFGHAACPACNERISIADAIAKADA